MNNLKVIFASNLIEFRQRAGLTQAELAEKINYSDKSISKWERGEAIPDAYVLKELAALFGVTVDRLLSEEAGWKKDTPDLNQTVTYSQRAIISTCVAGIFTLCFLEFVLVWAIVDVFHWIVLYAALPASLIAILVMNSIWYKGRGNRYIVGALVASLVVFAYLFALTLFEQNYWQLLLVIIPAEIVVAIAFRIRRALPGKTKKTAETREK